MFILQWIKLSARLNIEKLLNHKMLSVEIDV